MNFFSFRLKSLIHAPKISVFFGILHPKFRGTSFRPPKGTSLSGTTRLALSPHWSRSDEQFDLWPWQRNQKTEKRHPRQWQTGYSPRPPTVTTSPYRSTIFGKSLHAGWSPVCSSIFQVLLKSVQWFWSCGWSKIALPRYFGQWLIQQLVLPYKP